jgi:hypothetical protein
LLVGVQETLQAQIIVPLDGESFVLLMERAQREVLITDKVAAPLLNAQVVVPKVLCEALDYVKWAYN